jgi:hypothetical protein
MVAYSSSTTTRSTMAGGTHGQGHYKAICGAGGGGVGAVGGSGGGDIGAGGRGDVTGGFTGLPRASAYSRSWMTMTRSSHYASWSSSLWAMAISMASSSVRSAG